MNETYVAQLEGVTKRYGDVVALEDATLRVRPGEVLAVLGPNGEHLAGAYAQGGVFEGDHVAVALGHPFQLGYVGLVHETQDACFTCSSTSAEGQALGVTVVMCYSGRSQNAGGSMSNA